MTNRDKIEPNGKYLLDSAIHNLQCCFNECRKAHIRKLNNWSINDKGEHIYLGDYELMYNTEQDLKKKYEQAYEEVIKLKAEYARKDVKE